MHVEEIVLARYELRCSACSCFLGELWGDDIRLRTRCTRRDCRMWNWFRVRGGCLTTTRARTIAVDKGPTGVQ